MYLVLDQGGTSSRAFAFDAQGQRMAEASVGVDTHRPGPGRVEQDPEAIVGSLLECVTRVGEQVGGTSFHAAGLACQRSSIVCWDRESGKALTPVLSWQDTRAEDLYKDIGLDPERVRSITGLPPSAHYGATKLAWCLREVPAVRLAFDRGRLALGPLTSFLLFRLLDGRPYRANHTIAQRTLLFDTVKCDWSDELLGAFGITRGLLPKCVADCDDNGMLSFAGQHVPLTVCAGDQNTVPFAFGNPDTRTMYLNLGTGAFLLRPLAEGGSAPPDLLNTLLEGRDGWRGLAAEGTVNGAGSALSWYSEEHDGREIPWRSMDESMVPGVGHALFVNSVGDLGSPFWRTGVVPRFEPADPSFVEGAYAVTESIAFLVRANHQRMQGIQPGVERIMVGGGLSRNTLLCRLLASALGIEVVRAAEADITGLGMLALLGGRLEQGGADESLRPEQPLVAVLGQRYARWLELVER